MSSEAVAEVIEKALTDKEFLSQLADDPDAALADFDLSDDERAMLAELDDESLVNMATDSGERISKSALLKLGAFKSSSGGLERTSALGRPGGSGGAPRK